jgi:hypothetical protein
MSFKLIGQLSIFDAYTKISVLWRYLKKWEKLKAVQLTWKTLHLYQFFVLIQNLYLVFQKKSYLNSKTDEYDLKRWEY